MSIEHINNINEHNGTNKKVPAKKIIIIII